MITIEDAHRLAVDALRAEGVDGELSVRALRGGWRFWVPAPAGTMGNLHVLVVEATGRVRPISGGMLDDEAEAELGR